MPYHKHFDAVPNKAALVTPSDTVDLPSPAVALYIGGAGNVSVLTVGGSTVVYASLPAGTTQIIAVQRVNATGTTATNIIAEW